MLRIFDIPFNRDRIYGLDILRAAAILFVVLGHGNHLLPPSMARWISYFIVDGVSIFFVLSGFLIGRILINKIETEGVNVKTLFNFWVRRWFRTLPNYFLILIVLVTLLFIVKGDVDISQISPYFIFSQNLFEPHPWFFPEAWSLSVEEWFYLIMPVTLFGFIRISRMSHRYSVLSLVIFIIVVITLFRFMRFDTLETVTIEQWDLLFRKQVSTRLDSIIYGVAGAYIAKYHYPFWVKYKSVFFFIGLFLLVFCRLQEIYGLQYLGLYDCVFSFSIFSISILLMLPFLNGLKNGNGVLYGAITKISIISYSMYLVHLTIILGSIVKIKSSASYPLLSGVNSTIIEYSIFWAATVVGSILLYKYYELPMMKLRDRFKIS